MPHYLLSVHSVEGEAREPMSDEQMQAFMTKINELEEVRPFGGLVTA